MSEKRYKMMTTIIDPFPIWDTVEEKGYNCTDTLEVLVDLLNNLTEENERLKGEVENLQSNMMESLGKHRKYEKSLEEENEKLKEEIETLK